MSPKGTKVFEESVMLLSGSHYIANKNRSLLLLAQLVSNPFVKKNGKKLNINYND